SSRFRSRVSVRNPESNWLRALPPTSGASGVSLWPERNPPPLAAEHQIVIRTWRTSKLPSAGRGPAGCPVQNVARTARTTNEGSQGGGSRAFSEASRRRDPAWDDVKNAADYIAQDSSCAFDIRNSCCTALAL